MFQVWGRWFPEGSNTTLSGENHLSSFRIKSHITLCVHAITIKGESVRKVHSDFWLAYFFFFFFFWQQKYWIEKQKQQFTCIYIKKGSYAFFLFLGSHLRSKIKGILKWRQWRQLVYFNSAHPVLWAHHYLQNIPSSTQWPFTRYILQPKSTSC